MGRPVAASARCILMYASRIVAEDFGYVPIGLFLHDRGEAAEVILKVIDTPFRIGRGSCCS
jgi:hypothetical protein